jgi:N-acetylmuramoyl-L-alanine amidase
MKVGISAGHGGKDPGGKGLGMTEAKINLNVARKLRELLTVDGHKVVMIRDSDVYIGINERAKIANSHNLDLLLIPHHNMGEGDGAEVIYQMSNPKSLLLAKIAAEEFSKYNNIRRIFSRPSIKFPHLDFFGELRGSKCPAIITEFAFLDSKDVYEIDTLKEQYEEAQALRVTVNRFAKEVKR